MTLPLTMDRLSTSMMILNRYVYVTTQSSPGIDQEHLIVFLVVHDSIFVSILWIKKFVQQLYDELPLTNIFL